jgi:ATP-dependent Clp protease protease subunit
MIINQTLHPATAFTAKIEEGIKKPKRITVNKFDEESALKFADDFAAALDTGQTVIPVFIDSYGGEVYALFAMADIIEQSPVPVATIVIGKAMSAGAVLLSCGTDGYRFASQNAAVMIHEAHCGYWGKNEEIQSSAQQTERVNHTLWEMLSTNCGKEIGYFEKIYRQEKARADWFLTPHECKLHNLVNHIGIPYMTQSVNVQTLLKLNGKVMP